MEEDTAISAAARFLVAACREYKSGAGSLLNTLERDVYQAADRCWQMQQRPVQLRGGLIRSKAVTVQEATLLPEVEQQELGGALDQWREAVKSVVAAAALQVKVAEERLTAAVGRELERHPVPSADRLLSLLSSLLSAHDAVAALSQRDLRGTLRLLSLLSLQLATAWRTAGGDNPNDLLAAHTAAPPEVITALTAPFTAPLTPPATAGASAAAAAGGSSEGAASGAAAQASAAGAAPLASAPPAGVSAELAASLAALQARQRQSLEELAEAADVMRFWGRRSEKAAAGAPATGREGDVPPMMAQAQQLLWGACQAYDEAQGGEDLKTRQLVCQRYKPVDVAALQQRADEFAGGERLAAQQNLMYEPEFVEVRGQARTAATRFAQDKAVSRAASQLHQLRYVLLDAELSPAEQAAELAAARQQLLVRVAEALLDGSTPPAAAPLLVGMLQEGLRRAEAGGEEGQGPAAQLSDQDRARLVPMVCHGLVPPPGGRPLLRDGEGVALLRSLLRPEALLDDGKLGQFCATLQTVVDTCVTAAVPSQATEALLSVFDASRLAVLVSERAVDQPGGSSDTGSEGAGVQRLLSLAHTALGQPGADATGMAILEGLLLLQPASYCCAALQLALACGTGPAQQRAIAMLCRVPPELLPPPVLADALAQLAEALENGTLAPPFLPFDFLGRIYRTPSVLCSMQLATERGAEAAAAAAEADAAAAGPPAGAGQQLWTVRIGESHHHHHTAGGGQGAGEEYIASGSSAAQPGSAQQGERGEGGAAGQGQEAGNVAGHSLLLLPLQAGPEPLAVLVHRLVGSVLSCLLRRAGGAIDAATLSEELSALLEMLMLPASEHGAWMMQWLWQDLYQECLRDFLRDLAAVDPASSQLATAAFASYWASLPWQLADFQAGSPAALAALRLHLVASANDGAASVLLGRLDFTPVLAKAAPPARPVRPREDAVYSLGEEDEEEEEQQMEALGSGMEGIGSAGAWAAELSLLALHACVLLAPHEQPAWLQQLLHGMARAPSPEARQAQGGRGGQGGEEEESLAALMRSPLSGTLAPLVAAAGEHQPLLPPLMAAADWRRVAAVMHAEETTAGGGAAPWLLLPALLAPAHVSGDLGGRVVEVASLLSRAAVLAGSSQASETAAGAGSALLLCTLCQGSRHQQQAGAGPQAGQAADAAATMAAVQAAQQAEQQVVLPEGFPAELLEGTVEGQQLLLAQQEQELRQAEAAAAAADAAAAAGTAGTAAGLGATTAGASGQEQEVVEVQACWSLTGDQHVALVSQALLPLAAASASCEAAASWQLEQCPAELAVAGAGGTGGTLREWRAPHLSELLQAASLAAKSAVATTAGGAGADASTAAAVCVAALLLPLVRAPITVLQQDGLPFADCELPVDSEGAVYVVVAPSGAREGAGATADARVVKAQILLAIQGACKQAGSEALTACLLRLLYACPALHACDTAMQLSEGVLRFTAAPEQDGGPLGQGAAAAAAPGAEGTAAAAAGSGSPVTSGMLPAVTATQGLPPSTLLELAHSAALLHAPLTAALVLERLRQASTVLPKDEWQGQTTQVLQVALHADATPAHPFDQVAVWLAALAWVADARWRRLSSGPHQAALLAWLEALELRVVALQLAQPEDFSMDGSESTARRLLTSAADRFKSFKQQLPGLGPAPSHTHPGAGEPFPGEEQQQQQQQQQPQWAAAPPTDNARLSPSASGAAGAGGKELGQRLTTGFRSLLNKAGGKATSATGGGAGGGASGSPAEADPDSPTDRRKWGDKVRHRLAKMGLKGGKGEQQQQQVEEERLAWGSAGQQAQQGTSLPQPGYPYAGPGLVPVAEETSSFPPESTAVPLYMPPSLPADSPHLGTSPGPGGSGPGSSSGPGSGSGSGAVVRQKLSSGLQAVGRGLTGGLSKVKGKLAEHSPQGPTPDELAEHDRDVACRVGLAAFAVSAYIKSVLCPSLTPRPGGGDSTGPGTPTAPRAAPDFPAPGPVTAAQRYYHRTRSSFGSMGLDAEYLRELDRVIEARSELDNLDSLAACPLLAAHPGRYSPFLGEAPQLLTAATGVEAFQSRLQQLLFPGERQLAALA